MDLWRLTATRKGERVNVIGAKRIKTVIVVVVDPVDRIVRTSRIAGVNIRRSDCVVSSRNAKPGTVVVSGNGGQ